MFDKDVLVGPLKRIIVEKTGGNFEPVRSRSRIRYG